MTHFMQFLHQRRHFLLLFFNEAFIYITNFQEDSRYFSKIIYCLLAESAGAVFAGRAAGAAPCPFGIVVS